VGRKRNLYLLRKRIYRKNGIKRRRNMSPEKEKIKRGEIK